MFANVNRKTVDTSGICTFGNTYQSAALPFVELSSPHCRHGNGMLIQSNLSACKMFSRRHNAIHKNRENTPFPCSDSIAQIEIYRVLPIWIVKSNVSSVGPSSERNIVERCTGVPCKGANLNSLELTVILLTFTA